MLVKLVILKLGYKVFADLGHCSYKVKVYYKLIPT